MLEPKALPKVLVVDDNAANRALVQATLEDEGYAVFLASSGEEALSLFEAHDPDCLLLDVRMPGMDGLTLCRRVRALPRGADVPVVFLTALRDVDTFDEARAAGGDDFLTKPVRPAELLVRVEAALKLRRLTDENRAYVETVRRHRDELLRLQLQKEQLMAFVVHDLKNPVSAMDLHAQRLMRDKDLSEKAQKAARAIRNEASTLMRLITNLLDLSKSEEDALTLRRAPVHLAELVTSVCRAFDVRATACEVTFDVQVAPVEIRADADLLRRVLENLVDNALRHAPGGTRVSVHVKPDGGAVELRIADQGVGVPEAMRERIFDRFAQIQADANGRTGHGLGLAFCKLVVQLHQGTIWVEDGNPGAIFCVRLPHEA